MVPFDPVRRASYIVQLYMQMCEDRDFEYSSIGTYYDESENSNNLMYGCTLEQMTAIKFLQYMKGSCMSSGAYGGHKSPVQCAYSSFCGKYDGCSNNVISNDLR